MINIFKRLFRRRKEPVVYHADGVLRMSTHATSLPKATVFEINNPRLEIARRRKERIAMKARSL